MATSTFERIIGRAISQNIKFARFESGPPGGKQIEITAYAAYYGAVVLIIGRYETTAYHIQVLSSGKITSAVKLFGEDMDVSTISDGKIRTTSKSTQTYNSWLVFVISTDPSSASNTTISMIDPS